jgi:hypothetical protein
LQSQSQNSHQHDYGFGNQGRVQRLALLLEHDTQQLLKIEHFSPP